MLVVHGCDLQLGQLGQHRQTVLSRLCLMSVVIGGGCPVLQRTSELLIWAVSK